MAIDVENIQEFTEADLLKLYRWAMANNAAGQTRSIDGRSVSFPPLESLMKAIGWLESRVNATEQGGGIALVEFSEPR
jgi:hypothetical protein